MPPCAAAECERFTGIRLKTTVLKPFSPAATAALRPARPPPITNAS